jgi:hypothetical protein
MSPFSSSARPVHFASRSQPTPTGTTFDGRPEVEAQERPQSGIKISGRTRKKDAGREYAKGGGENFGPAARPAFRLYRPERARR